MITCIFSIQSERDNDKLMNRGSSMTKLRMAPVSPLGIGPSLVILLCLLNVGWTRDLTDSDLLIKIGNIPQPFNCSLFLDNLEELLESTVEHIEDVSEDVVKNAEVEIPRHWDFSRCIQGDRRGTRQTSYSRRPRSPDILVGEDHPVYQSNPWSLQHRGCKKRGLHVNLPAKFVSHQERISDVSSKGMVLSREWLKYQYGLFSESGYPGDSLYPVQYLAGNRTRNTISCRLKADQQFCDPDVYDSTVPTKQNLLCGGRSALSTLQEVLEEPSVPQVLYYTESPTLPPPTPANLILNGSVANIAAAGDVNEKSAESVNNNSTVTQSPPTSTTAASAPPKRNRRQAAPVHPHLMEVIPEDKPRLKFTYSLLSTTKYHVLLDQSSGMADNSRWINVKRALFRFIDLLPVGSRLNILAFGSAVKEVLPTTTVTELNRDGLFGRIPRRVLDDASSCVECALKEALRGVGHNEAVILISGVPTQMQNYARVLAQVTEKQIPIFIVTYPSTIHPSYTHLSRFGGLYSVVENSAKLHPLTHLQEILANIITSTEGDTVEKLHETHYNSLAFAGTFNYDREDPTDLIITLNVPDEEKVEFFEVKDPSGKKRIFSKFEDGMVYFKFSGHLPSGIWSYHAKLYHDSVFPDTKMSVDVVTKSDSNTGISVDIFASKSAEDGSGIPGDEPVVLFARITRHGLPILGAKASAELYMPGSLEDGSMYTLDLHDNGLGYPDITSGDGVYSAYVPGYGLEPGYYSVRLVVSDNNGRAVQPKGPVTESRDPEECCGSRIQFGNTTAPTGAFLRIAAGPSFYLDRGVPLTSDLAPPSRISDLSLRGVRNTSLTVDLAWTAPGGDLDFGKAHKYEIRCHTIRSTLTGVLFEEKGILIHSESVPSPLSYGSRQSCTVNVPWPNQVFYYAIVAFDEHGNRGEISNLVSVYIHEETTTTTTTTTTPVPAPELDPLDLLSYLHSHHGANESAIASDPYLREKFLQLSEGLVELKGSNTEIYIATGIVSGIVIVIVIILIVLVMFNRRKRSMSPVPAPEIPPTTTSSGSSAYTEVDEKSNLGQVSKLSTDGSSKVLLSWLDSLPKSESVAIADNKAMVPASPSPPSSHNTSMESTLNTISRRNHTLTRTNPYRHKVLTNGSFVSLKDIPSGSEEGSTRLTSSTLDDSNGSDTSSGSHQNNNVGLTSKSLKIATAAANSSSSTAIKRSNTSASALRTPQHHGGDVMTPTTNNLRRSHNTGYYSFRDYSPVYATATLGRGYRSNLPVLAEDNMNATLRYNPNQARKTKRTESFV